MLYELLTGEVPLGTFDPPSQAQGGARHAAGRHRRAVPEAGSRRTATQHGGRADRGPGAAGARRCTPSRPSRSRRLQRVKAGVRHTARCTARWCHALVVLAAAGGAGRGVAAQRTRSPSPDGPGAALTADLGPAARTHARAARWQGHRGASSLGGGRGPGSALLAGGRPAAWPSEGKALVFPPVEGEYDCVHAGRAVVDVVDMAGDVALTQGGRARRRASAHPAGAPAQPCSMGRRRSPRSALMLVGSTGRYVALVQEGAGAPLALEWALGERRGTMLGQDSPKGPVHLELDVDAEGVLRAFVGTGKDRRPVGEPLMLGRDWQKQFGEVPRCRPSAASRAPAASKASSYSVDRPRRVRVPRARGRAGLPAPAQASRAHQDGGQAAAPPRPRSRRPRLRPRLPREARRAASRLRWTPAASGCGPAPGIALSLGPLCAPPRGLFARSPSSPASPAAPTVLPRPPPRCAGVRRRAGPAGQRGGPHARARGLPRVPRAGDAEAARSRFDAAVQKDPGDPYALRARRCWPAATASRPGARRLAGAGEARSPPPAGRHRRPLRAGPVGTSPAVDELILKGVDAKALDRGRPGRDGLPAARRAPGRGQLRADTPGTARRSRTWAARARPRSVGPFSPFHVLGLRRAHRARRRTARSRGPFTGAYGPLPLRTAALAGRPRRTWAASPARGTCTCWRIDAEVAEGGVYVLRTVSQTSTSC